MTDQTTTEPDEVEAVPGESGGSADTGNAEQNQLKEQREQASDHVVGADKMVDDEPETFPREYVEKLRQEAAEHRVRAKRADELAAALWNARVAATGRMADPTDLPMPDDADPLDVEVVGAAVDELLARKPHLASRRPMGSVGQGVTAPSGDVDLAGMLRARV